MLLTHLSLTNFRNFSRLDIDVPGGPVLLVGGNAQGKTSLLELVYYLATFTSFHATQDRQLVSFFAAREPLVVTRITADFQYSSAEKTSGLGASHRIEVRLICERDLAGESRLRKEVLLDGVARKVGEAIGAFNAVLFLPHMLRIVEGPPEERRRYLNLSLGQVMPRYAADLVEYQRLLAQRNALLKLLNERGGDPGQLTYWDTQLAELGRASSTPASTPSASWSGWLRACTTSSRAAARCCAWITNRRTIPWLPAHRLRRDSTPCRWRRRSTAPLRRSRRSGWAS